VRQVLLLLQLPPLLLPALLTSPCLSHPCLSSPADLLQWHTHLATNLTRPVINNGREITKCYYACKDNDYKQTDIQNTHRKTFKEMVLMSRERTIIGSVSYRNRYWVYRIESYRLLSYRPMLRASLQVHQLLTDRITHDDQRSFKRPVTRSPRTHVCVLFYGP